MWRWTGARPAVDDDGVFGPVGLLANDVDKLQDAFDGVDRGDAVIRPRSVVQVEHVLTLVGLRGGDKAYMSEKSSWWVRPAAVDGGLVLVLTYPSLNFLMVHSGDSDSDSISTLISPYITGSSLNGQ